MEILWTIIGMLLYAIACYALGYHRGAETMRYSYDEGYERALKDKEQEELRERDEMLDRIYKEDQAREMIKQVGELFEDNDPRLFEVDDEGNIIVDCGDY